MRGDERRVVDAFCAWLVGQGWSVEREVAWVDVLAVREGERLYAEAKGRTAAMGLDIDTLYGQLLRRMPDVDEGDARYAVVVPDEGLRAATRVPVRIREQFRIDAFSVDDQGRVTAH